MKRNRVRRRTMLYIPGNNPAMIQHAGVYGADGLLLDLEDAVATNQKDAARILVKNMIETMDFYGAELTVRVNALDTPYGQADLEAIVPLQPDAIRVPKVSTPDDILQVIARVEAIEDRLGLPHDKMGVHPLIETALGVENAFAIVGASPRINSVSIGGQDLTADMQIVKTKDGVGIDYARRRIVMAAKAHRIDALDTVFADLEDEEGLREETEYIKKLGFSGKAVINPRQIPVVHEVYTPSEEEVRRAERIVREFIRNRKAGVGVFAVDGKMVDAPVVARAQTVLDLAGIEIEEE